MFLAGVAKWQTHRTQNSIFCPFFAISCRRLTIDFIDRNAVFSCLICLFDSNRQSIAKSVAIFRISPFLRLRVYAPVNFLEDAEELNSGRLG